MLGAGGVGFTACPAGIDEAPIKRAARLAGTPPPAAALELALAKAGAVTARFPDAYVVGADQILVAGDEWFDKPGDLGEARAQLLALRGRGHRLATAACVMRRGVVLWHAVAEPELAMRPFSETFLDAYLEAEGDGLLGSVGAYRVEGRGVQLFERIAGDHFAILGLPLLELLEFLRGCGIVAE